MKNIVAKSEEPRRKFLIQAGSLVSLGLLAGSFTSLVTSCEKSENPAIPDLNNQNNNSNVPKAEINLANYPELQASGSFKKITIQGKNNNKPLLVIRNTETEFVVLSSTCTHEGCEVENPDLSNNKIDCLCHGSVFGLGGNVLNGPATTALHSYNSSYNPSAGILTVEI